MFKDGILKVWKVNTTKDATGAKQESLTLWQMLHFDFIEATNEEYYLARQSGVKIACRVRAPQKREINSENIITIGDAQYRVGRTWSGMLAQKYGKHDVKVPITDISLETVKEVYPYDV